MSEYKITEAQFWLMLTARQHVYSDHKLPVGAKLLFGTITDCCHDEEFGGNTAGVLTISFPRLAKMIGASKGSVAKWIRKLERGGYITVKRPRKGSNSYSVRNIQN